MKRILIVVLTFTIFIHVYGNSNWQALGGGVNNYVQTIFIDSTNSKVYAGVVKNSSTDFTAYLNNSGNLTLNFFANGNEKAQLQLIDITGRLIFTQLLTLTGGFNKKRFQTVPINPAGCSMLLRLFTECKMQMHNTNRK